MGVTLFGSPPSRDPQTHPVLWFQVYQVSTEVMCTPSSFGWEYARRGRGLEVQPSGLQGCPMTCPMFYIDRLRVW